MIKGLCLTHGAPRQIDCSNRNATRRGIAVIDRYLASLSTLTRVWGLALPSFVLKTRPQSHGRSYRCRRAQARDIPFKSVSCCAFRDLPLLLVSVGVFATKPPVFAGTAIFDVAAMSSSVGQEGKSPPGSPTVRFLKWRRHHSSVSTGSRQTRWYEMSASIRPITLPATALRLRVSSHFQRPEGEEIHLSVLCPLRRRCVRISARLPS